MTSRMEMLITTKELIQLTGALLAERGPDARLQVMLISLEEAREELSRPELEKSKIEHLAFGIMRVFQDMLEFEHTPFGELIGELLVEINQYLQD